MKCIILEDEFPAQKVLENFISKTNFLECIGIYESPNKIEMDILKLCDLIFLDIEMPEITGLEFLKSYPFKGKVIVTSAYRDYAIEAFEENVYDYLLKPFSYARFLKGVSRVKESFDKLQKTEEIFVYADKMFHKVKLHEISIIKANVDYITIHCNSQRLIVEDSLNRWEEIYCKSFLIRSHRSFIVNIHKIEKVYGNQLVIDGSSIPIGKKYKEAVFKRLKIKNQ